MNVYVKPRLPENMCGHRGYAAGDELGRHVRRSRKVAVLARDIRESLDLVFSMHEHYTLIGTGFMNGYLAESKASQL